MGILLSPVERVERRFNEYSERLANARRRLNLAGSDVDERIQIDKEIEGLVRDKGAALEALAVARELAAKEAAEAAKTAARAQIDAYRREAEREVPSRLNKIDKLARSLAVEMNWLADHRRRADEINKLAREHGLPGVADGETLHRKTPDRTEPAQFEMRDVWRDAAGNQPSQFRQHPETGELVPVGGGSKRMEKVQVCAERFVPGEIPGGRLSDAMRLMSVTGERLFPSR